MTEVEIEYCVPCGLLDKAQDLQAELLEEFGTEIDSVRLKTGDGGVFEVRVDGEKVYDKDDEGYDAGKIKGRVRDRL